MKYFALGVLLLALGLEAGTAASTETTGSTGEVTPPPLNRSDLEAYFDGFLPFALQRADIAGAVVVVVKDGQTLFQKGYGSADSRSGRPVDPDLTLFRPGSISKLFTWTAIMQLVEAGRVDLDRDINDYLDFRLPPTFDRPITLRHLLTHTAGFEDTYKNILMKDAQSTPSIEAYVKNTVPPRLFPPGATVAYSNYGATLAGYIVQRVSGEPYATYIARHVFEPLGMGHSTFVQPVPAALSPLAPQGYRIASQPPLPFEFIGTVPAGALSTTGADMAHFMIAHLEHGHFGEARILGAATATLMHAPAYRPVPGLQAMSLGFYGENRNGHRIIGHAGDLISFHADLHLLLDDHVGLFLGLNSLGNDVASSAVRAALFEGFMNRYFPAADPEPEEPTLATAVEHGKRLEGEYELSRRVQSSFPALGNILAEGKLTLNDDGTIALSTVKGFNDVPKRWREIAPFVWRQVHGTARLAAVMEGEKVRFLASDDAPPIAVWQPVPGVYAGSWNLPLLGLVLAIFVATLVAWPVAALVRRHYRRPLALTSRALWLRRAIHATVVCDVVFLVGWLGFLLMGAEDLTLLTDASDWLLRLVQLCGVAGLLGLAAVLVNLALTWRDPARGWWPRLWSSTVALAFLATTWFAFAFHLLSASLRY
jgi:CubicO group peptidase (beta-lactamase class C family)